MGLDEERSLVVLQTVGLVVDHARTFPIIFV